MRQSQPSLLSFVKVSAVWLILFYLRFFAKLALAIHKPKTIGIAGSIGKSSTRNAVATILGHVYPIRVIETNSETGLPLGILGIKPHDYSPLDWVSMILRAPLGVNHISQTKYLVIEMGIDDPYPPKNMEYLLTIVQPDIGIITYESAAHTMQFAKVLEEKEFPNDKNRHQALVDAITQEDLKLLTNPKCTIGIINADNPPLTKAAASLGKSSLKLYTFGKSKESTIQAAGYEATTSGTEFSFALPNNRSVTLSFKRYCLPEEYQGTFGASLLLADILEVTPETAKRVLEKNFHPPKGRASIFEGVKGTTILDSSYNASRPTVLSFFNLLGILKKQTKRPTVAILADMLELGLQEKLEHEEVAKSIPGAADFVYLVGPLTKQYILPILKKDKRVKEAMWFASAQALNDHLLKSLPDGTIVLVKGSQGQLWLEESIKLILKNKEDVKYLCRQDAFWQKVKKKAGRWIEVSN